MKRTDRLRLEKREIRGDYKNSILALLVEITLFAVILVLLTFTIELDGLFDSYCKKELPDCYSVTVKNISEDDRAGLEEDGIRDLELYPAEDEDGTYEATGTLDSFERFDWKKIKWKFRGVTILSNELEEFVDILIFVKAIFVCLSVIGIILCVLAVCGLYSMKVESRTDYSLMLMRLGLRERTVKRLFLAPFLGMDIISVIIAYGIARGVLGYFNRLIRSGFGNLSLSLEKLEMIAGFVLVVSVFLMVFTFGRRWNRQARV